MILNINLIPPVTYKKFLPIYEQQNRDIYKICKLCENLLTSPTY